MTAQRILLFMPLLLTVLVAKVSLPPFSTMGLGIALPLVLALTFVGTLLGYFEIHAERLLLYLILVTWSAVTQLRGGTFSLPSLAFLIFVFFPLVLRLKATTEEFGGTTNVMQWFGNFASIIAVLGILQYVLQFFVNADVAFPLEHYIPQGALIQGYNYLNPLYYGSPFFKANGVFFLEPSFFSQFLAIALLVELAAESRVVRIMLLVAALACTFSGTGLIVLAVGGTTLVVSRRRWDIVLIAIFIGTVLVFATEYLKVDIFLDRAGEFARVGTSGFERFVAWTYLFQDQLYSDATRAWAGFGAGSFFGYSQVARYRVWESSFAKMAFEFGIPGLVFYLVFLFYAIHTASAPANLKFGLATCIFMNGAYSESNVGLFLTLLLWPSRAIATTPPTYKFHFYRVPEASRSSNSA